ncbi:tyrosine--tRNA ligase [Mycoplasmatota bacterium zrk1]
MNLFKELELRNCIAQVSDPNIENVLNNEKVTFYLGIDPTADSMHVGHLFGLINCRRLQLAGHKPIILVGGATGMIGDPSGKSDERNLLTADHIDKNVLALSKQISKLIDAKMVNNYDWTKEYDVITFLRDIGKYFNINYMLAKESVKTRLDNGISYTEFTYQIMQALDFLHLYKDDNCTMQVGGTEQWGNITAGLELIRKHIGHEAKAYGLNWPLITKSDGTKFGKTAGGAVWLDPKRTSPYEFYQFWINTPDGDVITYLKQFTFLSLEEIDEIEKEMIKNPHLRNAQKILGKEVTSLVHSEKAYTDAVRITEALFSGNIKELSASEIEVGFKDVPSTEVNEDVGIIDALVNSKLASSKREARQFLSSNAVSVNGDKVSELDFVLRRTDAIEGKFTVIKRGKKKYAIVSYK